MARSWMAAAVAALAVPVGCGTPPATAPVPVFRLPVPAATRAGVAAAGSRAGGYDELRPLRIGPQFSDEERAPRAVTARPGKATAAPVPGGRDVEGRVALTTNERAAHVVVYDARTGAALPGGPTATWSGPGSPHVGAGGRWLTYIGWGKLARELVLWDVDQGRRVALPPLARGERSEPDVSADGNRLIYLEGPARDRRLALYDVALHGETFLHLQADMSRSMRTPTLSADGMTAAFVAASARGDANIHVLDLRTGRPLAPPTLNTPDQERDPALSADGRVLVFSSDRNGTFDLYAYDLVAGAYLPMGAFNSLADESEPRFLDARDRGLAYVSTREGAPLTYAGPLALER